jgi:hypothetical protein
VATIFASLQKFNDALKHLVPQPAKSFYLSGVEELRLADMFGPANNLTYFLNQLARIFEVPIDTCKTNVCDLINQAEVLHHAFSDKS